MKIYEYNTFMTTNQNKIWDILNTQHFEIKQKITLHRLCFNEKESNSISYFISHLIFCCYVKEVCKYDI